MRCYVKHNARKQLPIIDSLTMSAIGDRHNMQTWVTTHYSRLYNIYISVCIGPMRGSFNTQITEIRHRFHI